jgi:hypothetical protein
MQRFVWETHPIENVDFVFRKKRYRGEVRQILQVNEKKSLTASTISIKNHGQD